MLGSHSHLRLVPHTQTILLTLQGLTYTGDSKNYNFDKYVTNHVQQHNLAMSLIDYGGTGLDNNLKINYF
jgi:hypothetical protein